MITTASQNKKVEIWQADGKLVAKLEEKPLKNITTLMLANKDIQDVTTEILGLDKQFVEHKIVEISTVERLPFISAASMPERLPVSDVTTVTFSPNGLFLASANLKGTIILWHWNDNDNVWEEGKTSYPSPHNNYITNLVFSPNSKMLLSASNDGEITLWQQVYQSTWSPQILSPQHKHKREVTSVAFSLDNQFLVTADQGGEGRLWKIADSKEPITIKHTAAINKVRFFRNDKLSQKPLKNKQPNQQLIATASSDKTIKFWTLDGTLLTTFKGHRGGVTAIDFSPSGELFALAGGDHTVILWDISKLGTLKELIKKGCMWIKDYLTDRKDPEILKEECGKIIVE